MKRLYLLGLSAMALGGWTGCGEWPVANGPTVPVAAAAKDVATAATPGSPESENTQVVDAGLPDADGDLRAAESGLAQPAATLAGTDAPALAKNGEKCETECKDGCMPGDTATVDAKSSHKQARVLQPLHEGKPIALHTFCVTASGDILACVGSSTDDYGASEADRAEGYRGNSKPATMVQVYGPDLKLKQEIAVKFKPTAINPATDGKSFYVAGEGRIAQIAMSGEVLIEANSPNIGDPEKFEKVALSAYKREIAQQTKTYTDNIESLKKQVAKVEATPEANRTAKQKAQLDAFKLQIDSLESVVKQFEGQADESRAGQIVKSKMIITALATTEKDIFVCCRAIRGYGYEIWRTTTDLNEDEGVQIVSNISGCCGQLDIQAHGDRLLVAENGKFQVTTYDREGEEVSHFGKRDRSVIEGWGSCCNPMNIRCLPNGGVLVAESSIGNLKTYDQDGKFVSYVGKAKVSGGCKHVACGYDQERNRYYFMNVDKGHICVLVPAAEAPAMTDDERQAHEAREGLGKKFTGVWAAGKPGGKSSEDESNTRRTRVLAGQAIATRIEASNTGELKIKGGLLGQYTGPNGSFEWNPAKQVGNQLQVRLFMEGVDQWGMTIDFVDDNTIKVKSIDLGGGEATTFYRQGTRPADETVVEESGKTESVLDAVPLIVDLIGGDEPSEESGEESGDELSGESSDEPADTDDAFPIDET